MRVGLVGSPRDIHLRRWGSALGRAGAGVWVFGLDRPPEDASEKEGVWYLPGEPPLRYVTVGRGLMRPGYWDFIRHQRALAHCLRDQAIDIAHPIHLSPYGVWVYLSGFRPYIPFVMGSELEYTAWARRQAQRGFWTTHPLWTPLRQHLLPLLLRPTLSHAKLILADNYTLCENIKVLCNKKTLLEIPAGIDLSGSKAAKEDRETNYWVLSPRGLTQFYQADLILQGFYHYWIEGGRLGLLLLANLYQAEKNVLEMSKYFSEKFYEKIKIINRLLSPAEMQALWRRVVAFISAPSYDGYSYSIAEGRWAGAIPLLNAIPGNLEVATHRYNALFIHPFIPETIAQTLHTLENELSTLQASFAPRNLEWIRKFSDLDNHARLFLQVISDGKI